MQALWIIEKIEGMTESSVVSFSHGPASLAWFEPGVLRFAAPSQDVTTVLLFLAAFLVLLVLSIATLNFIGNRREKQRASLLALVKHTTLNSAMVTDFRSLAAGDSLGHAAQTALRTLQNDFPVVDGERLVGSLSRSALLSALERHGPDAPLRDRMQPPAPQAESTDTVSRALRRFHYTGEPLLWIVEKSILVGLVTPEGLEQYLQVKAAMARNSKSVPRVSPLTGAESGKEPRVV